MASLIARTSPLNIPLDKTSPNQVGWSSSAAPIIETLSQTLFGHLPHDASPRSSFYRNARHQNMYGYQGAGGQQPLGAQPTGFGFGNTPVQQQQQQQPMQPMQQSQPTGYQAPGGFQNYQPTGFAQQQQQPPQQTGYQSMQQPMQPTGFQSQPNVSMYQGGGGQGYQSAPMLQQQTMQTGYQPQQQQQQPQQQPQQQQPGFTGFQPQQQQQQTGFSGFQQQPQQQPQQTGFGGFQSQPTGYAANSSVPAATPAAPLQQQKTGNARDPFAPTLPARPPLTSQPTGGGNKSVVDGIYIPNGEY